MEHDLRPKTGIHFFGIMLSPPQALVIIGG